jgi:hypothetical protein
MGTERIFTHDMCVIDKTPEGLIMKLAVETGGWVTLKPLPSDPRGLAQALDVAQMVVVGKIWLTKFEHSDRVFNQPKPIMIKGREY